MFGLSQYFSCLGDGQRSQLKRPNLSFCLRLATTSQRYQRRLSYQKVRKKTYPHQYLKKSKVSQTIFILDKHACDN